MAKKLGLVISLLIVTLCSNAQSYVWSNLSAAPYTGGKQDGIFFISKDTGWVVNGAGKIFKTFDGGTSWIQQMNATGTYFRCVAFMNNQIGFAGNIGVGYFPGVTDTTPLYKTIDGGNSWASLTPNITGVVPKGICAIDIVNTNVIYAAGRVGSPAMMMKSTDGGNNWVGQDLSSYCQMIFEVHFQSPDTGYIFAGTDVNVPSSHGSILRTTDGGVTWKNVYTSARNNEIMWKAWFPSHNIGYATIQSFSTTSTQRYIAKTSDGGLTWSELPLVNSAVREFGIGFVNDTLGWVGGESTGYETRDGGLTWTTKSLGRYANKFSIIKDKTTGDFTCYAVGLNVYKTNSKTSGISSILLYKNDMIVYPNPCKSGSYVSIALDKIKTKIVHSELIDASGKKVYTLFDTYFLGTGESPFMFKLPEVAPGNYMVKFTDNQHKYYTQSIIIKE